MYFIVLPNLVYTSIFVGEFLLLVDVIGQLIYNRKSKMFLRQGRIFVKMLGGRRGTFMDREVQLFGTHPLSDLMAVSIYSVTFVRGGE